MEHVPVAVKKGKLPFALVVYFIENLSLVFSFVADISLDEVVILSNIPG